MSGHTPGPWGVIDGAIYAPATLPVHAGKTCAQCGHDPLDCGPAVIVPVTPGPLLADIKNGHWDDCDAPKDADLRLMAAAPDLLAELRNMVTWCCHRDNASNEDAPLPAEQQPPEVRAAMRAIAKVEDISA